ncbi:MAG TPA: TIGR01620 family protein, partial [Paracoccaceae bacterium]
MTDPLPRKPLLIDWHETEAPDPGAAPPVPDADLPQGRAMQAAGQLATARGSGLSRLALWAFGALFSFAIS